MLRRTKGLLLACSLLALLPGTAAATPGTCTIVTGGLVVLATVPSAGGGAPFLFPLSSVDGFALPVDIDASAGRFTLLRGGLPDAMFTTDGGPVVLQLAGADAVGTIDAGGNVSLPDFVVTQVFGGMPLTTEPVMSTAIQSKVLVNTDYPRQGKPIDFTTGMLTLAGPEVIPNAPIVNESVIAAPNLTCRLEPIPDRAALPAGASAKVNGKAKTGPEAAGDTLSLKAKLAAGSAALDFAASDVFVQVTGSDGADVVLVLVHAGMLKGRGKRLSAKDSDGSTVRVTTGHKPDPAPFRSKLAVTKQKNGAGLSLRVAGLDLSKLTGSAVVTVTVGPNVATTPVTVRGSGKKRTFR